MALIGGEYQTQNRSDWKYWLGVLRGVFTGQAAADELRGSDFADAIVERFKEGYVLEDKAIGQWFATLEAAETIEDSNAGEFEARFLLSREQQAVPDDVWDQPVHRAIHVSRDFAEPSQRGGEALILFFSFSDLLPVRHNLKLFRECAVSRLTNLTKYPIQREFEMEDKSGAAGAD